MFKIEISYNHIVLRFYPLYGSCAGIPTDISVLDAFLFFLGKFTFFCEKTWLKHSPRFHLTVGKKEKKHE